MTSLLKQNLATDTLLIIDGKGKNSFENTYAQFIKVVNEVESFLTEYIKVCCNAMSFDIDTYTFLIRNILYGFSLDVALYFVKSSLKCFLTLETSNDKNNPN